SLSCLLLLCPVEQTGEVLLRQPVERCVRLAVERAVAAEQLAPLIGQRRAAPARAADAALEQGKSQLLLTAADDAPRLVVAHLHARRAFAQRAELVHAREQLRRPWAEQLVLAHQPQAG